MFEIFKQNQFNTHLDSNEAFSAIISSNDPQEIVRLTTTHGYPPLWNILQWITINCFGMNETVLRILPIILLFTTALFVFLITNYIWGKKSAFFATFLTLLNPLLFANVFENGVLILSSTLASASMLFFVILVKDPEAGIKVKLGYLTSTILALVSHQSILLLISNYILWSILVFLSGKRIRAKKVMKATLLSLLLFSPIAYMIYRISNLNSPLNQINVDPSDLKSLAFYYLSKGIKLNNLVFPFIEKPFSEVALWVSILILIFRKWHRKTIDALIFLTSSFGVLTLGWIVYQKVMIIDFMNQLSYITPFLMIILSTGRRQLSTYLVTLLILIFAIMDIHYFVNPNKPDFPELKTFLTEENNNDVTNLIWEPSPNISYVLRYYGLNIKSLYYQNNNLPFSDRDGLINNGDYIESIEDINKIGIITNSEIGDNFSDSHTLQNTVKFKGVNYFVLTKND